jgi:tetratricopeptide (TPR) repeat protein
MSDKRFRVAFSFAGEKRDFVAKVAAVLAERLSESAILFDRYHEAEFARPDLGLYLPKLYLDESELIVAVLTPNYNRREWSGFEIASIRDLLKKSDQRKVMLCRFGAALPKGFQDSAGFVELDHKTPSQTAAVILERLALNEGKRRDYYTEASSVRAPGISGTAANNLPRLSHFFGRDNELRAIANSLEPDARTWGVLIDGAGGIGKTSLAVRAAELTHPNQFERIIFVSSKEVEMSPDGERRLGQSVLPGSLEMLSGIAHQMGLQDIAKTAEVDRARFLLETLKGRRVLLILDNLESLRSEQRDQLYSFLSRLPAGCKAIVTSRRRTDVDARIIRLAKERPILARASDAELIELYEETGGSPLFMRWVVGQLGRGKCKTIRDALSFLRSAPIDNDPLEFAFGDLLETFTENETKVLAALTYFTGPVKAEFIAELSGKSKGASQTALEDLADRALIVADAEERKYGLVPLVADFLRVKKPEVLRETGDRLEKGAYALVVENGYGEYDRFPMLDAAWPTVAAALPRFLAGDNGRLQIVCNALRHFLDFTGRWDEWLALSREAESRAVAAGDLNRAGYRAYDGGWVHFLRGQYAEVLADAVRAEDHWREAQAGTLERIFALQLRGHGHRMARDYPAAIAAFREAVGLSRTTEGDNRVTCGSLSDLANAERLAGDFDSAERDYREALRIANAINEGEAIAIVTGRLAGLALDRKDFPSAEALAREALPLAEKIGRLATISATLVRLAIALVRQEKKEEALPYARRAVEIYHRLGMPELSEAQQILAECENSESGSD